MSLHEPGVVRLLTYSRTATAMVILLVEVDLNQCPTDAIPICFATVSCADTKASRQGRVRDRSGSVSARMFSRAGGKRAGEDRYRWKKRRVGNGSAGEQRGG